MIHTWKCLYVQNNINVLSICIFKILLILYHQVFDNVMTNNIQIPKHARTHACFGIRALPVIWADLRSIRRQRKTEALYSSIAPYRTKPPYNNSTSNETYIENVNSILFHYIKSRRHLRITLKMFKCNFRYIVPVFCNNSIHVTAQFPTERPWRIGAFMYGAIPPFCFCLHLSGLKVWERAMCLEIITKLF